jgi:hypothetical protein
MRPPQKLATFQRDPPLGNRERYAHLLLEMAQVVDKSHGRLGSHALTMAASSHIRQ